MSEHYDSPTPDPGPARPVRPGQMLVAGLLALVVALAFAGAGRWAFFALMLLLAVSFGALGVSALIAERKRAEPPS